MKSFRRVWLLAALLGMIAGAVKEAPAFAAGSETVKVVVHVNFADIERQGKGLKNIMNILDAAGQGSEIELVAHGAGIDLLVASKTKHAEQIAALQRRGVRFVGCENTMTDRSLAKSDLLDGVKTVPSGALEIARKQHGGFAYFRP